MKRVHRKDKHTLIDWQKTHWTRILMELSLRMMLRIQTCCVIIGKLSEVGLILPRSCYSGKMIAKKTFQLHYNHCIRNIQKCTFCDQPIAKSEMEDHLEEMRGSEEKAR